MTTMPVRIDMTLFEAAKATGAVRSRSAAQQLAHWARIGREFESSANVTQRDIDAVLVGDGSYNVLQDREQSIVRATWAEHLSERIATFDLGSVIEREGVGLAENDDQGRVLVTDPDEA